MQTLNNFFESLENIVDIDLDAKIYLRTLTFRPFILKENLTNVLGLGRWDMLFLNYNPNLHMAYGLRILPDKKWTEWPVYRTFDLQAYFLYCPSITSFLPTQLFDTLNFSYYEADKYKNNEALVNEILPPFLEVLGGKELWSTIRERFIDVETIDFSEEARFKRKYSFKFEQDTSESHQLFRSTLQTMIDDGNLIPFVDKEKLGIYEVWLMNVIAYRMSLRFENEPMEKRIKILWDGFTQIHGYDSTGIAIDHEYGSGTNHCSMIYRIAETFDFYRSDWSQDIINDPLYPAICALLEKGENRYNGVAHLHAAATLYEDHKDALGSFNALASGSCWAGRNFPQSIPATANQALHICEKEGWDDAATAITYQLKKVGWY